MVWLWLAPVLILLLLLGVALVWLAANGGLGFPWFGFYSKGKESGFAFREIDTLRRAAVEAEMENPLSIFSSIKVLDRTIRNLILRYRDRGTLDDDAPSRFLAQVFEFRKQVEFNLPRYRNGVKTTRELMSHQRIRITLSHGAVFHTQIVENQRKYLAVAYPKGDELPADFSWKGQRVNVYFWRPEDAGYYFESKVLEDFLNKKFPLIYLAHSDSLIRSQKRSSIRLETDLPCQIFHLKSLSLANETVERTPGYKARLVDLSEEGCALLVGGKAKVGLAMKVQFSLGETLTLSGTIRGITYDEKKNRSVLHVQALQPSPPIKNAILAYVYNIFDDRDEAKGKRPTLDTPQDPPS